MKRIEFIAPVESMRGNLGSKQFLVYNPNNNRAFDSIEGQLNPALNYEPRLIGAKGKRNYFCVKTKSTCHLTPSVKSAMANLGGVGAIYSALVRDKMSNVYINAKGCYDDAVAGGYTGTFRKYMYSFIKQALDAKESTIDITTTNHSVSIDNPWYNHLNYDIVSNSISKTLLIKFFFELFYNGGFPCYDVFINGTKYVMSAGWENVQTFNCKFYNGFEVGRDISEDIVVKFANNWVFLKDKNGNTIADFEPNGEYFANL